MHECMNEWATGRVRACVREWVSGGVGGLVRQWVSDLWVVEFVGELVVPCTEDCIAIPSTAD